MVCIIYIHSTVMNMIHCRFWKQQPREGLNHCKEIKRANRRMNIRGCDQRVGTSLQDLPTTTQAKLRATRYECFRARPSLSGVLRKLCFGVRDCSGRHKDDSRPGIITDVVSQRHIRLTVSNFGRVLKRRAITLITNLVKSLL